MILSFGVVYFRWFGMGFIQLLLQVRVLSLEISILLAWRLLFIMSRVFRNDILAAESEVNILSLESEFERLTATSQLLGYLKQLGCQLPHLTYLIF